jgi:mannose-6-phosphate isomerase-like protein (cupin superfamily)
MDGLTLNRLKYMNQIRNEIKGQEEELGQSVFGNPQKMKTRKAEYLNIVILFLFFNVCSHALFGQPMDQLKELSIEKLIATTNAKDLSWYKFIDVETLYAGIYTLKAGQEDKQKPHEHDELYIVLRGVAKFNIEGKQVAVAKDSILYVPAGVLHFFSEIKEDLDVLVVFSKCMPRQN